MNKETAAAATPTNMKAKHYVCEEIFICNYTSCILVAMSGNNEAKRNVEAFKYPNRSKDREQKNTQIRTQMFVHNMVHFTTEYMISITQIH